MTVTRGDLVLTPVTVIDSGDYLNYDFYIVKPGDVITVDNAGEAKRGDVKAGYDVKSNCVNKSGEVTNPLTEIYSKLPETYTVGENDVFIDAYDAR